MNEKIKSLLIAFKQTESTHRGAECLVGDEIEKFAELIVQECSSIIKTTDDHYRKIDPDFTLLFKEHFGV
jgi:hypothetical protein